MRFNSLLWASIASLGLWMASPVHANSQVSTLMQEGRRLVEAGNYAQALAIYQQLLQSESRNPRVHSAIGYLYAQQGQFAEAARAYQRAIELDQQNADFYYALGYSLGMMGENHGAAAAYRQAIRLNNRNAQSYEGLAVILARMGDPKALYRPTAPPSVLTPAIGRLKRD